MGYTQYWSGSGVREHDRFAEAVGDMGAIIRSCGVLLEDVAIDPAVGVRFNGAGDDSCEVFNFPGGRGHADGFSFCKTRQRPYDVVVTACLAVAADLLPVRLGTDGEPGDWEAGVALASRVLGRAVPMPTFGDAGDSE